MEHHVQKDQIYINCNRVTTTGSGMNCLSYNIRWIINNTVDPATILFSGPTGDFKGASRRPQFDNTQESIYSGYKHIHSIKAKTTFVPNRMSCVFGPVSGRGGDHGTLNLSNIDSLLGLIQEHLPPHLRCMLFGDSLFCELLH